MKAPFGLLLVSLVVLWGTSPTSGQGTGKSTNKDREIAGYVSDFSDPGLLVLTDQTGVKVNDRTEYWVQPARGKKRKGTISDVRVQRQVRIVLNASNIAKSITVLQER